MNTDISEIVGRILSFVGFRKRIKNSMEFTTFDHKYGIRRKLGLSIQWIAFEVGNPAETAENTFSGSIEDCKKYVIGRGYEDSDIIPITDK